MALIAPTYLPPFSDLSSGCEVVRRRVLFAILGILWEDLVQFVVTMLLGEAGEVQGIDYACVELEDRFGGRIVDRLDGRLGCHWK